MEMPTSLEEYNKLLAAWKEAGLGNGGGNLVQNNFTYDYPFRTWPIDEKERALYSDLSVPAFTWEPTHKFLQNLNYQYNNGLIDPEFYLIQMMLLPRQTLFPVIQAFMPYIWQVRQL